MKKSIFFLAILLLTTFIHGQNPVRPLTPMNRIESQVQNAFTAWAKKGEFEKTIVYNERIANNAVHVFDSLCEHYIFSEINEINRPITSWSNWSMTYNADEEFFQIKYTSSYNTSNEFYNLLRRLNIHISIPIENAPQFKQNHNGRIDAMPYGFWKEKNGYLVPSQLVFFNNSTFDSITNADMPMADTKDIVISSNILPHIPQALKGHSYKFKQWIPAKISGSVNNPQPSTNPNATFQDLKNGSGGKGKGTAIGSGQAGSPNGTQGVQGGTGSGIGEGYSLGGRGLRGTIPLPSNKGYKKEGKVVVEIWVDRDGNVVDVKAPAKGSKNYDNAMVEAAKQAAREAHFNNDPNAPETQKGTITYKFRRVG